MSWRSQRNGSVLTRLAIVSWQQMLNEALQHHQAGRLDAATARYHDVLRAVSDQPDALHLLGVLALQQGRPADAVPLIERAVAARSDSAVYHGNLGVAYQSLGRADEARSALERAVALDPRHVDALFNLGVTLQQLGEHEAAVERYRTVLALVPNHANAGFNLGNALQSLARYDEAIESHRQALALGGTSPAILTSLGAALAAAGRTDEALACFGQAVQQAPDDLGALQNLTRALRQLGRSAEALAPARHACEVAPNDTAALRLFGAVLRDLGHYDDAIRVVGRALEVDPTLGESCQDLGSLLMDQSRPDDALPWFERAAEARPDDWAAWANLGIALDLRGDSDGAVEAYGCSIDLEPRPGIQLRQAMVLPVISGSHGEMLAWRARWASEVARLQASGLTLDDPLKQLGRLSFFLAYQGLDDRPYQEQMARFYLDACPSLAWTAPHCQSWNGPTGKIRVGVISRFLSRHTIGKLMRGMIGRLDRSRFEVTVFQLGRTDDFGREIAGLADRAVWLSGSLTQHREQIAAAELDVLVYADVGMDPTTYFLAFARLAPVQCVTWGHPVTTGIPNMDDFLSADTLEPPGAEAHYSERLVRLDRLGIWYARPTVADRPADRASLGLPEDATLYVCPQSLFKLHPDFDLAVAEILRRDRRGRLVLIEGLNREWGRLVRERLARTVPEVADRVLMLPRLGEDAFFNLLRVADIVLDSFHFGGGNTTYEAFAIGMPIVTWPGPFMRGRVTLAAYRQMGVDGPIAETPAAYVDLALALANDPAARGQLGEQIRAASASLYEDDAALAAIERYLVDAVAERTATAREGDDDAGR
jgi:predicted O-linked N-acetylglucosamine transferase (SPINDLY family)